VVRSGSGTTTTSSGGGGAGGGAATSTTITSSLPMGWTVELIVEALEAAAQPVGQRRAADDDHDEATDGNGESVTPAVPLPYAGGRVLALLADRPTEVLPNSNVAGTWRRRR
jgi:hypothetical protein